MINYFVLLIVLIAAWAYLYPDDALVLITELKRQLRLNVIRHAGAESEKELAQLLHDRAARLDIDTKLVDQVIAENHEVIMERLGNKDADWNLGEQEDCENCF